MKRLPADLETLRQLHLVVENYLAELGQWLAVGKAYVSDLRLAERLGERGKDVTFPSREVKVFPAPPHLVSEYAVDCEVLAQASEANASALARSEAVVLDESPTPNETADAIEDLLVLPQALFETYKRLGAQVLDAIECVSNGEPVKNCPPKPQFDPPLSKIRGRLFDAIWELADWSHKPPIANMDLVVMETWGSDSNVNSLNQTLSRLNNDLVERGFRYGLSRRAGMIQIDLPEK